MVSLPSLSPLPVINCRPHNAFSNGPDGRPDRPRSRVFLAFSAAAEAREANNGCSTEYTVGAGDVVEIASPVAVADDGSAAVYPNHLDCNISIGLDEAERSVFSLGKALFIETRLDLTDTPTVS